MKEPTTYWRAREVREIADELIPDFHEHLFEMNVRYIFESKHSVSKGRVRLAHMRKVSGLNAYLAQAHELEEMGGGRPPAPVAPSFFLMVVAHDTWMQLTGSQRIALVDHELKHIGADGELVGHDIEEFADVVARHGIWKPDLAEFIAASKQQPLFEPTPPAAATRRPTVDVH